MMADPHKHSISISKSMSRRRNFANSLPCETVGRTKRTHTSEGAPQSWDERSMQEVVIIDGIGNRGPDKNCSPEIRQNTDEPRT